MVKAINQPLFSILLPTHNRADVIGFAIQSILKQTETSFELFIVGDGCTDATEEVVTRFAKKDPRVQWLPFPKGPGFGYSHRNVVLRKAQGKYIAFAPHDDVWFPDHLQICKEFLQQNQGFSLVYTRPLWVHPEGYIVPSLFNTDVASLKQQLIHSHNEIPAQCVVHTRESMKKVGYWNTELPKAADWDLWRRIILDDPEQRVGFVPTPTGLHFRAIWRTEQTSADSFLKEQWLLAKASKNQFSLLLNQDRVDSTMKPQQQKVWEEMQQNKNWVTRIRTEVIAYSDYATRQVLLANIQKRDELAQITDSRSYKVVQLLQKLAKPFSGR